MEQKKKRLELEKELRELSTPKPIPKPPTTQRGADPIYSKIKEGIKQAKTAEKSEKGIEESGLSEEQKKKLRKEIRIALETQREEK